MTEREQRDLAWRIADVSDRFDFDSALELVQLMPEEAEKLIRRREEGAKRQERLNRAYERLHRTALEYR